MAPGDYGQASIALPESVEIVEHLDVPLVPLGEVDGVFVFPVVVVLVETKAPGTAHVHIEERMTKVILCTNHRLQQRGYQGRVEELFGTGALVAPRPFAKAIGLGQIREFCGGFGEKFRDLLAAEYLSGQCGKARVGKHRGKDGVTVFMESVYILLRRYFNAKHITDHIIRSIPFPHRFVD